MRIVVKLCVALLLAMTVTADVVATPIKFARGKSSKTIERSVVRGDRDFYSFEARAKQTLLVKITSVENNAVFDVYAPGAKIKKIDGYYEVNGKELAAEQTNRKVVLPKTGKYLIVVGGTRGNATYKLTVAIE
jgi:predicted phage tail protein